VVAYGKIFPDALITLFPKGVINVHYSLLPKYRGASPMEAALLAGDAETGVSVQRMVLEVDAGDILAQEKTEIGPDETARELRPRLIDMGAKLLVASLPGYLDGSLPLTPQDASQASRAPKFQKEAGLLSLDAPDRENWHKYRAYADTIGTYFMKDDKRYKITKASYTNGTFKIERVIPEGKREMDYA
jgi:methionyl-tRNA formyltransferase